MQSTVYLDNGDFGMTYFSKHKTDTGCLLVQMRPNTTEHRYPKMNRKRPLWGDRFDHPEEDDDKENKNDKKTENRDQDRSRTQPNKSTEGKKASSAKSTNELNPALNTQKPQQKRWSKRGTGKSPSSEEAIRVNNPKYRTKICVNFTKGKCKYGDKCTYIH